MGQFSRIYANTNRNIRVGEFKNSYLLVPKPFQDKYGEVIIERCYDGYGRYGSYDVYDLIAEWNKEFIPEMLEYVKAGEWESDPCDSDIANLQAFYEGKEITCEQRIIGILMACYDADNERLPYPIKVTTRKMDYDDVPPSKNDPNQGCRGKLF